MIQSYDFLLSKIKTFYSLDRKKDLRRSFLLSQIYYYFFTGVSAITSPSPILALN